MFGEIVFTFYKWYIKLFIYYKRLTKAVLAKKEFFISFSLTLQKILYFILDFQFLKTLVIVKCLKNNIFLIILNIVLSCIQSENAINSVPYSYPVIFLPFSVYVWTIPLELIV